MKEIGINMQFCTKAYYSGACRKFGVIM